MIKPAATAPPNNSGSGSSSSSVMSTAAEPAAAAGGAAASKPKESEPTSPPSATGAPPAKDEDAVKLFVGQIPKDMDEEALRPIFAEFGSIFDLTVIRDKATGIHRGCAFLTYTTKAASDKALDALHNKRKLANAQNPLQVRRCGMCLSV